MSDPRNVAHKKKVTQEKHHQEAKPAANLRKGKNPPDARENQTAKTAPAPGKTESAKGDQHPGDLEKSLAVLSKLKDLEFHSRANIEALAQLSLTVEEELKQREFSEAIGAIYSAQDAFHSKIAAFIETYQTKCESLKSPA
jgi:histidinol phosphatase-like enzyme